MVTLNRLFAELKQGRVFSVYLLLGENQGAKDEFLQELQTRVFTDTGDRTRDISVFYGDEANTESITETLGTYSFLSERRLVVVRRFEKLLNIHPVVKYLESPNVDSILVLLSEKNKIQKSVTDATEKKGQVCICWPMFQNESERWIDHKLAQLGIEADTDAVKYIIELTGTSTQELSNQIEYISNYLERGEVLTLKTVKSILARLYHYTVFDLCNALFIKTAGKIVEIFRYLVHIGEDPVKIIYFCGREMRKILNAHALTISGYDYHDIIRTLKFRKSEADRIKTILRVIDTRTISTLYARLADLDYTLKSNPKEIGMLKLEKFLVELGR